MSGANLEMPDHFGRKSGECCKNTDACKAQIVSQCSRAFCDCETSEMDFSVSGLGTTKENGLKDLGGSIAVSPNGKLMVVAGKYGAWASKSDTFFQALYDDTSKLVVQDSSDIIAAAGDQMVCFAVQSRVRCVWAAIATDPSGSYWRDINNFNLPEAWGSLWGARNFLINTQLHEQEWCPQTCDVCFAGKFGSIYKGTASPCYGISISVDSKSVAISGRTYSGRKLANDVPVFKGFVQIRTVEETGDGQRQWRSEAAYVDWDHVSFGTSVALRGRILAVGAPLTNEDDIHLDGVDAPGSVIIFVGSAQCPSGAGCAYEYQHTLSAPPNCNSFGQELALNDRVLVVGASGNSTLRAAVFIYRYVCTCVRLRLCAYLRAYLRAYLCERAIYYWGGLSFTPPFSFVFSP